MDPSAEFAGSLRAATKAIATGTRKLQAEVGKIAREEHDRHATEVPGADRRFSRSKKPANRVKVRADRDGEVRVSPVGAWGLAETGRLPSGTNAGTVAKQGKRSWSKGQEAAQARIDKRVPEVVGDEVEEAFLHG